MSEDAAPTRPWMVPLIWIALVALGVITLGSITGGNAVLICGELVPNALITAVFLLVALGLGDATSRLMDVSVGIALTMTLGIAALMMLTSAAGALGVLHPIVCWIAAAVAAGWGALSARNRWQASTIDARSLVAAPAVIVLVLAACTAPGVLWSSEFGGYDALSYHLQLPREWVAAERIVPLEHNVYSFLPGGAEAIFTALMTMFGIDRGAVASQSVHAATTIIAAALVGTTARSLASHHCDQTMQRVIAITACALTLGTPWAIVTGSLAYNEMFVVLMAAGGWFILLDAPTTPRRALLLGVLLGAAVMAKLPAAALVAVPLGLIMLRRCDRRHIAAATVLCASGAIIVMSPWLLRNLFACGNPLFPFLTDVFGAAHWTPEQAQRFADGHTFVGGFGDRIGQGFNQLMRYGIGPNPDASGHEPWALQWSVLPWLALIGGGVMIVRQRLASTAQAIGVVTLVQVIVWLSMTHVQSRFMLPLLPGAVLATVMGMAALLRPNADRPDTEHPPQRHVIPITAFAALWCLLPGVLYLQEVGGRAGGGVVPPSFRTGLDWGYEHSREAIDDGAYEAAINLLPAGSHVLLVGDAAPFYLRTDCTYTTVWDRGPLSVIIADNPEHEHAWCRQLSNDGFTHLVIVPHMLQRWHDAAWADPALHPGLIVEAAEANATRLGTFQDGRLLYRLD